MRVLLWKFVRDETGATAVEYGILLFCLSLIVVGGFEKVTNALTYMWGDTNSRLNSAWTGD